MKSKLSTQQKRFADGVLSGLPAGRAYEQAGYISTGAVADSAASTLLRNQKVSEYIESSRSKATSANIKTAIQVKEGLSEMMDFAKTDKDYGGYTQLANRLAKMEGHDAVEKKELTVSTGGVLLVPMADSLEEWEQNSIEQQEKLQQDTIDI